MHNFTRIVVIVTVFLFTVGKQAGAQPNVMFEIGATYFVNNEDFSESYLNSFLALTINTRINLHANPNSAFSLDIPLSIRSKFTDNGVTRFGFHLPAMVTYNIGAGSSGRPSDRKMGYFIGAGWGYFFQQSKTQPDEIDYYNEKLSAFGPAAEIGFRFRMGKVNLWKWNTERDVHPSVTIKFIYQSDLKNKTNNIAGVSMMAGLVF